MFRPVQGKEVLINIGKREINYQGLGADLIECSETVLIDQVLCLLGRCHFVFAEP